MHSTLEQIPVFKIRALNAAFELGDFLVFFLEWVVTLDPQVEEVANADIIPVEVVRDALHFCQLDELPTHLRPGVLGRINHGFLNLLIRRHTDDSSLPL